MGALTTQGSSTEALLIHVQDSGTGQLGETSWVCAELTVPAAGSMAGTHDDSGRLQIHSLHNVSAGLHNVMDARMHC